MTDILSKRDREKFSHNGFLYVFDRESQSEVGVIFWRCERRRRCKARVHVKAGEVIREINIHTHEASAVHLEVERVKTKIKKRAADTLETPSAIVNQSLTNVPQACLASIPKVTALRKIIKRKRTTLSCAPSNPTDLWELCLPESYKIYIPQPGVEENFLLCDSGPGDKRILIFGRASWLQHLVTSEVWFADGTFSITPLLFSQIYVISAKKHRGVHPIIYALLPDKQRATYVRMFQLLLDIEPNLNPTSIICDFEQGAHSAMREVFPNIQINGCFSICLS